MVKGKSGIRLFLTKIRIKIKAITNRCPRQLRKFEKPLIGGLIGLIGGIPGFFIGLLLGYLLGELFVQTFRDKKIIEYLENPGSQQLNESEPGLAAWCALGILIAAENQADSSVDSSLDFSLDSSLDSPANSSERILKQVFLEACYVFNSPLLDLSQIEHFSRLAWQKKSSLNPDLLAESFIYRRAVLGDSGNLARRFNRMAVGKKAKTLAGEIILIIDPAYINDEQPGNSMPKDPWKILGLPPGTPPGEVKAHYRRLAKQFHPDNLEVLDEAQKETAARAFVAIKEAYQKITGE